MSIHPIAEKGFGTAGEPYEKGRPGYPAEAVSWLVERLGITAGKRVVDLGAGTGKWTRLLVPTGAHLTAVEPVEGMRRKFSSLLPALQVVEGSAESMPFPDASAEALTVAQAFHWFDGPAALREIHRVLQPGGKLGLIWNVRDESVGWVAELTRILDRYEGAVPRYRSGEWKRAFEATELFTPLEEKQFRHVQKGSVETVLDRVRSTSFISVLAEELSRNVLNEVCGLLRSRFGDASEVEIPYRTDVYGYARI